MKKHLLIAMIVFLTCSISYAITISGGGKPQNAFSADTAKSLSPVKTSGEPGMIFMYEANGTDTNGMGLIGPASSTKNMIFRFNDESPIAGQVLTVDSVATDQTVATPSGNIVADIVTFILSDLSGGTLEITEAATLPDPADMTAGDIVLGIDSGDMLIKTATRSYLFSGTVTDDPDTTDPSVSITTPAADNSWVQSATYTSLAGTSSDNIGVQDIYWKLESGGTYANTNVTGTTSWSVSSITLSEGTNNVYVRARDAATNDSEAIRIIKVDTVNPVGVADADSTHNGVDTFTSAVTVTETNLDAVTFTATGCSPSSGSCSLSGGKYVTPSLTPSGTGTVTVTFAITDLSGRTASGTDLVQAFTYSGVTSEIIRPNSTAYNVWTFNGATNHGSVSDQSDSTTVTTTSANTSNYWGIADASTSGTITSVDLHVRASSTVGGNTLRIYLHDGSYRYAPDISLTTSLAEYTYSFTTNPATGAAWTGNAAVNAYNAGVRSVTTTGTTTVSEFWIEVKYE